MKTILVIGATGFIGRGVVDHLSGRDDFHIIKHSRRMLPEYLSCELHDQEFIDAVGCSDFIVNCSGIGLSKLNFDHANTNSGIATSIVEAVNKIRNNKIQLLHLSSIKAHNPCGYEDLYSDDKSNAETILLANRESIKGEILRIPAVLGKGDKNLAPIFSLAARKLLPVLINHALPSSCFLGVQDISKYIEAWIDAGPSDKLILSYLISDKLFDYNNLVKEVNSYVNSEEYESPKVGIKLLSIVYFALRAISKLNVTKNGEAFPKERFQDLFYRSWDIEKSSDIKITTYEVILKRLIEGYSEKV